ncbi:fumarylacetoacetate hydrolase family protein [Clostridium sp. DJ247]|nr:fumarylacetoacetate hydrolase family protein [Clostridium sp. DJ247]
MSTGTPSGIQAVKDGDILEVTVEKIGALKNTVKIV